MPPILRSQSRRPIPSDNRPRPTEFPTGPQDPKLLNLLGRIGAHNQNNPKNPASIMPELFEDEKALLVKFMKEISARGEKQMEIFNAMQKAFGISKDQIKKMPELESAPNGGGIPDPRPGAVLASA